jgi:hypothetical protein
MRYRKIVPLAHTKWDAEQAEIKPNRRFLINDLGEEKVAICTRVLESSLINK